MAVMDGYVRVSRVAGRSGDSYISPTVQREAIERWAQYKGVAIGEWLTDEDQSGGKFERPALTRGIKRALAGESAGIVSAKIDRFSRASEQGLRDLRRLRDANARLAFVQEDIDTSTVYGRMIYTILLAVSEAFLENIKATWIDNKTHAIGRGAYIARTPFGYRKDAASVLEPDPVHGPHVTEAYRLAATLGVGAAARYLHEHCPGHTWNAATTRRLLRREAYLGHIVNGDLVQRDAHPPLTDLRTWEAAQTDPGPRAANRDFPLTGMLRCQVCGGHLIGGRGGSGQRSYCCAGRRDTRGHVVVTADRIESYVLGAARELVDGMQAEAAGAELDLSELEAAMAEADAELTAFASDLTLRRALGDRYHATLQLRVDALDAARDAYRTAAQAAQYETVVTGAELDLADADVLRAVVGGLWGAIEVRRGRGLKIEDRTRFLPPNADGPAGMASA